MANSLGGITRVSSSLQTARLLAQLRQNSLRVFQEQERLTSGERLLSIGDDPVAADSIGRITQMLAGQDEILSNLRHADSFLSAADAALTDASDILTQAQRIASEQAGSIQSTEERAAQAAVIDGLIDQLRNIGNSRFQGVYLFGGRLATTAPLTGEFGRVTFAGDTVARQTRIDASYSAAYDLPASEVFGLRESVVGGYVNFNVQVSTDTRVSELAGANSAGVRLGRIQVAQTGPALSFEVDFTGAETVGDLIAKFNAAATAAGSTLTLGTNGNALRISPAVGSIAVTEVSGGTTAADLGIKKSVGAVVLDGDSVKRRVALTTKLTELQPGGLALPSGIAVTNGQKSATVTFAGATTVQDVLNRLNSADVGIRAFIKDDGTGFQIENQVAGTPLVLGENGGADADALGIKTIDAGVPLSRLNGGRGIHPISTGADFRVTNANGVSFDVTLGSAATVGDVISAINAASLAAGAGVSAQTSLSGAGFRLTGPAGPGVLSVQALNLSPAASELGIAKTGTATALEGDAVGAFVQTGVFSALYRLRDALLADSSSEITEAGSALDAQIRQLTNMRGIVGARSSAMRARTEQTDAAVHATRILLSDVKDVDFTEAVTKFQQAQTALQASLFSAGRLQNLSLLDFLQ